MKTTIELPDNLLNQAKQYAASRGKTFRQVLIEALSGLVVDENQRARKPGIEHLFGAFANEKEETRRIQQMIDEEFSNVDPEDWK